MLSLPFEINGYTLFDVISNGASAVVYKATSIKYNNDANHYFAVKVMPLSNKHTLTIYRNEVKSLCGLMHPNIVNIFDYFVSDTAAFIVLEYCCGSLENELHASNYENLTYQKKIEYASQILDAFNFCHTVGVCHRDIKPANILINISGKIKIIDFGFSLRAEKDQLVEVYRGTPMYCSPEVLKKTPYDPYKADIWAIGVVFFKLFTGSVPWETCDPSSEMLKVIEGGSYLSYAVFPSKEIFHIFRSMLNRNPKQRMGLEKLRAERVFIPKSESHISLLPPLMTSRKMRKAAKAGSKPQVYICLCKQRVKSLTPQASISKTIREYSFID